MKYFFPFILLVFSFVIVEAQKMKSETPKFKELSKSEKKWAILHPRNAIRIKKITSKVRRTVKIYSNHNSLDSINHGGKIDAFRHALWMALIAQKCGERIALNYGKIHEKGNYEQFLKNKQIDGFLQDSISCEMDLRNNKIGATIKNLKELEFDTIVAKIIRYIETGELYMLKHNSKGNFTTCSGEEIRTNIEEKNWVKPYCLIKSNEN